MGGGFLGSLPAVLAFCPPTRQDEEPQLSQRTDSADVAQETWYLMLGVVADSSHGCELEAIIIVLTCRCLCFGLPYDNVGVHGMLRNKYTSAIR